MLLDGHELHRVIAGADDAWQDRLGKLAVSVDAWLFAGHADVGFVD